MNESVPAPLLDIPSAVARCKPLTAVELYNKQVDLFSSYIIIDCRSAEEHKENSIDLSVSLQSLHDISERQLNSESLVLYGDTDLLLNEPSLSAFLGLIYRNSPLLLYQAKHLLVLSEGFRSYFTKFPFLCTSDERYATGRLYPSKITENVYLSNYGVASNPDVLSILNITHIVNCTIECPYAEGVVEGDIGDEGSYKALRVPVTDDRDQNIQIYFDRAVRFINDALSDQKNGKKNVVLIHCKHGQSRSATIAAAWLLNSSIMSRSNILHGT